jgi:hypothetical protein
MEDAAVDNCTALAKAAAAKGQLQAPTGSAGNAVCDMIAAIFSSCAQASTRSACWTVGFCKIVDDNNTCKPDTDLRFDYYLTMAARAGSRLAGQQGAGPGGLLCAPPQCLQLPRRV